jgi:hypothetical protein
MSGDLQALVSDLSAAWWRYVARRVLAHTPPPRPRRPSVRQIPNRGPLMRYRVTPAPPTAPDVVVHEVSLTIGGVAATPLAIQPGQSAEFEAPEGSVVTVSEVQVDDAGNRSEPSDLLSFAAADTIPPARPGQPSVELVGE